MTVIFAVLFVVSTMIAAAGWLAYATKGEGPAQVAGGPEPVVSPARSGWSKVELSDVGISFESPKKVRKIPPEKYSDARSYISEYAAYRFGDESLSGEIALWVYDEEYPVEDYVAREIDYFRDFDEDATVKRTERSLQGRPVIELRISYRYEGEKQRAYCIYWGEDETITYMRLFWYDDDDLGASKSKRVSESLRFLDGSDPVPSKT